MSDVLIVDDSPDDRALFRTILRRAGFAVHEAATGGAAPALIREARPHVVVLDVNLPDTTGHDVCRALRADPLTAGLPVLMLTAFDNDRDVLAGLEAGADDYVAKDAAPEVFLARVRRLVRYRQMATTSVLNEQLAQIGRLLAGIVHEIRGPLSVVRGNAELLRMRLPADDASQPFLDPILRNCQLLQARLEHLMAAVRVGPSAREALDVGPLVREAADLFLKGVDPRGGRVALATELVAGLPPVLADAGRLMQVVLNLLANAHEAIVATRAGGRIAVTTAPARDEAGSWVVVEVCDDGPGIPEAYLARIFEPFFTTKEKGSGYGLYLASEILREHGGRLTAANLDGGGARFTMWLPQAPAAAAAGPSH
ncbi:MAG TPA: response regulator [Isosphaeraceae bacterium]|jgi:signal transduction histidine kinase|nr:response regulator [Isosphaeraceae bacterium]